MSLFNQHTSVDFPGIKIGTALGAGGGAKAIEQHAREASRFALETWADLAAVAAFAYSLLLIGEFFWKWLGRPYAEKKGWLAPRKRRLSDKEDAHG